MNESMPCRVHNVVDAIRLDCPIDCLKTVLSAMAFNPLARAYDAPFDPPSGHPPRQPRVRTHHRILPRDTPRTQLILRQALCLSFNLFPGQYRFRCAWHACFAGEKVAGSWAFAAAFGPAGSGAGGFRDTGGCPQAGADVAKPPADSSRGRRQAGSGCFSQGRRRPAARGRARRSWACAAMRSRTQRSACSGALTFAAVRPGMPLRVRIACSMSNLAR